MDRLWRCPYQLRSYAACAPLNLKVQFNYMYDGSLTTPTYGPVKWIVADNPKKQNLAQLTVVAKSARVLQPLQGRILLYNK